MAASLTCRGLRIMQRSRSVELARLLRPRSAGYCIGIMLPAIAITAVWGDAGGNAGRGGLAEWPDFGQFALVLLLTGFHLLACYTGFRAGQYPHTARFFRAVNELPAVAMVVIVALPPSNRSE